MKIPLPAIRHDQSGFEALIHLNAKSEQHSFGHIEIDMAATDWFDADMCAAFGAILYRIGSQVNSVYLINLRAEVEKILSKNGFLSNYGGKRIPDKWGTTIPYQRFEVQDDRYFANYVATELVRRAEMPQMSSGLIKKFRESVFEIFSNSVIHSQTKLGIFSCGQYFPKRNRLDFSVVDLGIGIRQNIKQSIGFDFPAEQAIAWATQGNNTTKRGRIPGGLGLKLLSEFIKLNDGRIQIVSDAGYFCLQKDRSFVKRFSQPFPGTAVSIEINTADTHSYLLSSELSDAEVF